MNDGDGRANAKLLLQDYSHCYSSLMHDCVIHARRLVHFGDLGPRAVPVPPTLDQVGIYSKLTLAEQFPTTSRES